MTSARVYYQAHNQSKDYLFWQGGTGREKVQKVPGTTRITLLWPFEIFSVPSNARGTPQQAV